MTYILCVTLIFVGVLYALITWQCDKSSVFNITFKSGLSISMSSYWITGITAFINIVVGLYFYIYYV